MEEARQLPLHPLVMGRALDLCSQANGCSHRALGLQFSSRL